MRWFGRLLKRESSIVFLGRGKKPEDRNEEISKDERCLVRVSVGNCVIIRGDRRSIAVYYRLQYLQVACKLLPICGLSA